MAINLYLNFNGNCREAVEFYSEVFGTGKPQIMTYGDAPPSPENPIPNEAKGLIMHTELEIAGSKMMFSDSFPGMPYVAGNNYSLTVVTPNQDEITAYFNKLKAGGKVGMELQETFFSKCYGMVTDKFGIQWQVSLDSGDTGQK